jgi:hypothetical protein
MKTPVYFFETGRDNEVSSAEGLVNAIRNSGIHKFIKEGDVTAVKTHFGETPLSGYPRPVYIKEIGGLVKEQGARPFLTETSTLYKGNRTDAISHIAHAHSQGFGFHETGMPIIMADGLYGDEEAEIPVKGEIYGSVKIASLFAKIQSMVTVSHFTGHLAAGFGAAMKNLGMGCASRRGKMIQHSTSKPKIREDLCTRCGVCAKWCPVTAIEKWENGAYKIDRDICIGCGQCLAVCRFDAVAYNWGAAYDDLQKKIVEHAMGALNACGGNALFVNFLTRVSKDCDCMDVYEEICPDIGILFSRDPVAIDAASLDLFEERAGRKLSELSYDIPYRVQIDYGHSLGLGSREYRLIKA